MEEERKMILKMIEDGKITAEEGIKLLESMGKGDQAGQTQSTDLSTEVKWSEGEDYRKRAEQSTSSATNLFTTFIESTIQKIKDVDLDFNFGSAVEVDHIFQHHEIAPTSLDLSLENGTIIIKPWDERDVRIECQAKVHRVKNNDEARRELLNHSTFRVDEDKLMFHTKSKAMKVKATVYVPKRAFDHIKLYTFNGQIVGEKIEANKLEANALNGGLFFSDIEARKVDAETVNGVIELNNAAIDVLDVETINGEIKLTGPIQDIEAETLNGSIYYDIGQLKESGYADLKVATGSIQLSVPNELRIEGKLKTNVGNFSVQLRDHEIIEEKKEFVQKSLQMIGNQHASPRVKVNALTNTGSIIVKDRN